ncbi:MAG: hypothetical protein ACREPE_05765 [Lysobacter sp.]
MSNVIEFLESLGNKPALSTGEYIASVALLDIGEAERQSLLLRDQSSLNDLLGGRTKMLHSIFPAQEEEQEVEEQREQVPRSTPGKAALHPW